MRRVRWGILSCFAALAILHTWPLTRLIGTYTIDFEDGLLNNWLIASVSRRLLSHPLTVFDVNMYYPYRHALATVDHQLSTALLMLPVTVLSRNALLPANIFIVASFVLAGLFMAWLVEELTGSIGAGVLAGCVYAFSPLRLENVNHTHVLANCWFPLTLLMVRRFIRTPTWARLAGASAAFLALALATWYYAVSGAIAVAILGGAELTRSRPERAMALRRSLVAIGVIGLALGAVARPYLEVTREYAPETARAFQVTQAAERTIDRTVEPRVIQEMAASAESYVGVAAGTRAPWSRALNRVSPTIGSRFFPGMTALIFGAVALALLISRQVVAFPVAWVSVGLLGLTGVAVLSAALDLAMGPILLIRAIPGFFLLLACALGAWLFAPIGGPGPADQDRLRSARLYFVLGVLGVLLSFGQEVKAFGVPLGAGIYPATLPPFNMLRASSRFSVLFSLSAAVLAGIGCAAVLGRLTSRTARAGLVVASVICANAELFAAPLLLRPVGPMPEAYAWLKDAPPGAVVDFPIHGSLLAMYWSIYHGHPLVNGNGAMQPAPAQRLEELDDLSPEMLESIRTYWHPRYVVVDRSWYLGASVQQLEDNIARNRDTLKELGRFGRRSIYEITGPSRGAFVLRSFPSSMLTGKRSVTAHARVSVAARGAPVVQIWGNGQLLTSKEVAPGGAFEWLTAPLPADHGHGVNIDVLGDYVLAPGDRPVLGRSGQRAPADIALTITPERTRIQVNSHTWIGEKGYTVVALDPDGGLIGIRAFNTSWSEDDSHALAAYLGGLPRGTVVAVATFFDASRSLTDDAVRALAGIGLTGDLRGHFGWAQAGIGVAGAAAGTAVESTGESSAECRVGQPADTTVELEEVRLE